MRVIGIDPGKKGCLVIIGDMDIQGTFFDWPKNDDIQTYFDNIAGYIENELQWKTIGLAAIERVHAMPKQGVSSMFSFGMNYGMWLAFLSIYHIPFITVPPQTWMKGLISKADGVDTKAQVYTAAKRLFPHATLTGPKGGRLDGRADALMIAYYARQRMPNNGIPHSRKL